MAGKNFICEEIAFEKMKAGMIGEPEAQLIELSQKYVTFPKTATC
jgi:hypothetical protein